jgi:DivIVA domain-containing protein
MSEPALEQPEFAVAMRGYDRPQVDEYVARLQSLVADAEERVRVAEAGAHATVGPRVTQIFDLATAESVELRTRAQAQADALLADARTRAEELVAAAEREAESITAQARAQGEEALTEMQTERGMVRKQVDALEARKSHLIEELRRLQAALGSAADSVADIHAAPPGWDDEGKTETLEQPIYPPDPGPGPDGPGAGR